MDRIPYRGGAAGRGFPPTREGPPTLDLEILALQPVNRLVPDESLFARKVDDDSQSQAADRDEILTSRRRPWM